MLTSPTGEEDTGSDTVSGQNNNPRTSPHDLKTFLHSDEVITFTVGASQGVKQEVNEPSDNEEVFFTPPTSPTLSHRVSRCKNKPDPCSYYFLFTGWCFIVI